MEAIVAVDLSMGIGLNNALPWGHIKEDMALFMKSTMGKRCVMGRKTYESLVSIIKPKAGSELLIGRQCIVISNSLREVEFGTVLSVDDTLKMDHDELIIIGGASIYTLFEPHIDRFLVSTIEDNYPHDTKLSVNMRGWNADRSLRIRTEGVRVPNITFTVYNKDLT